MATFRTLMRGSHKRAYVSRLGHSEAEVNISGWNLGVYVIGDRDKKGNVIFTIYKTKGFNND